MEERLKVALFHAVALVLNDDVPDATSTFVNLISISLADASMLFDAVLLGNSIDWLVLIAVWRRVRFQKLSW